MIWRLSDGTVLELGGKVTGDGRAAYLARRELALPVRVHRKPAPSTLELLDPKDPELLDAYVQSLATYLRLEVLERPKRPTPPPTEVEEGAELVEGGGLVH